MALTTKIKHIDTRANGVLRFRRRFPKDVAEALGEGFLQVHVRNTSGLAFHREYQAIMNEFDRMVSETRERLDGVDTRPPIERWHEALLKAEGLIAETSGLDENKDFIGHMIAEGIADRPDTDPLLIKALVDPEAAAPDLTLADAKLMYATDKGMDEDALIRLDRITRRLEEVLGPLDKFPLKDMKRDHGRRYLKHMLKEKKANGEPLAPNTCLKEGNIISAMTLD